MQNFHNVIVHGHCVPDRIIEIVAIVLTTTDCREILISPIKDLFIKFLDMLYFCIPFTRKVLFLTSFCFVKRLPVFFNVSGYFLEERKKSLVLVFIDNSSSHIFQSLSISSLVKLCPPTFA